MRRGMVFRPKAIRKIQGKVIINLGGQILIIRIILIRANLYMQCFVTSGILVHAGTGRDAESGMFVGRVQRQASLGSRTRRHHTPAPRVTSKVNRVPSASASCHSGENWGVCWETKDFIKAHKLVLASGKFNFQGCRIPVPTLIRHDRIRAALGDKASLKELRVLELLEFGMPFDCRPSFGIISRQKNHFSAIGYKQDINDYIERNLSCQALIGPFRESPFPKLCFIPLMSVPKEGSNRRVIMDFSFPPGRAVNDGICKSTYLDFEVEFSLPSVQSMVARVNELGAGCLLYKRDLKGAFRQFSVDPGDYRFAGLSWNGMVYFDTRLAMGLRCAAYCCQSVTEIIAKIASREAHVLVYLDDFGGAELADKAQASFEHLGQVLAHYGLVEAPGKAVSPSTCMDWLGVRFDTIEWTMAIKPGKLS